jgi:sec-independent protein translocase protein TatC
MRKLIGLIFKIAFWPFQLIGNIFESIDNFTSKYTNRIKKFFTDEPEDTTLPDAFVKTVQNPTGIFEHINALRKHLFRALGALVLTTAFSFTFAQMLLDLLAKPAGGLGVLIAIDVTEPLSVLMKISLLAGFTLALPYIIFELFLFAAPGLTRSSRISGLLSIPVVVLFFLGGMAFAYFVMLPTAIPFLTSILGIKTQLRPSTYFSFATNVMFFLGLAFEFPILIYILASLGFISPKNLRDQWRLAIVIIAIVAAIITPTVDPVNMGLIMAPLFVLYILSIGLASIAVRRRTKREFEAETSLPT